MDRDEALTSVPPRGFRWEPMLFWMSLAIGLVLLLAVVLFGDGPAIGQRAMAIALATAGVATGIWVKGGVRER